jgi:hypothetical protein
MTKIDDVLGPEEKHESWGMISLGRWSSSHGEVFFNSPLRHHHGISLTLHRASRRHSLNTDRVYAEEEIFDVNLTEVQFGQLISSFNVGGGTPCTIGRINGKRMSKCPPEILKEKVGKDVRRHFEETHQLVKEAQELASRLIEKPSVTKGERKSLKQKLDFLEVNLSSNLDFLKSCFVGEIEQVVTEAKAELQAHANSVIQQTGIKALKDSIPEIEE